MDRPIHLALFIDDLIVGGTQNWLVHLATALAQRGFDLRLYAMRARTHPAILRRLESCAAVEVIGESRLWRIEGLVHLARELRAWPADVLQTLLPTSDWLGRTLGRWTGVPAVLSSIRGRNVGKPFWQRGLDRATARWAQAIIFNNRDAIPFAIRHEGVQPHQALYIPNGVAVREPSTARARVRAELQTPDSAPVIGTVARLHAAKNQMDLLRAFAVVRQRHSAAVLWLVGEGDRRAALQKESRRLGIVDAVRMPGVREDVDDVLAAMDLFALPSRWEGMPNALMEAMAAARPVIAADLDGIRELVSDGETGWRVPPGDVSALAAALLHALDDSALAARMGQAARRRMQERFSLERMVAAYEAVYRERLARAGGPRGSSA
ncbi:MAG: glycosyltransferase [Kiritimatiellia bacterium]